MKKQAQAGEIDLAFLDESGFAPPFHTSYTWARRGLRAIVPYEAPEQRHVNVLGALLPWAAHERFLYRASPIPSMRRTLSSSSGPRWQA